MTKYELSLIVHCEDKELNKEDAILFMLCMGVSSQRSEQLLEDVL